MGKRGPKPKPTAMLKAAGSWRANGRTGEPQPAAGPPRRPAWFGRDLDPLNDVTEEAWEFLSSQLADLNVLRPIDGYALAFLCESITAYVRAHRQCMEQGETALNADGTKEMVAPWSKVRDNAFKRVMQLLREYGLTPASRTGLQIITNVQVNVDASNKAKLLAPPS